MQLRLAGCCFGVDFFAASSAIYKTTEKVKRYIENLMGTL